MSSTTLACFLCIRALLWFFIVALLVHYPHVSRIVSFILVMPILTKFTRSSLGWILIMCFIGLPPILVDGFAHMGVLPLLDFFVETPLGIRMTIFFTFWICGVVYFRPSLLMVMVLPHEVFGGGIVDFMAVYLVFATINVACAPAYRCCYRSFSSTMPATSLRFYDAVFLDLIRSGYLDLLFGLYVDTRQHGPKHSMFDDRVYDDDYDDTVLPFLEVDLKMARSDHYTRDWLVFSTRLVKYPIIRLFAKLDRATAKYIFISGVFLQLFLVVCMVFSGIWMKHAEGFFPALRCLPPPLPICS